MPDGNKRITTTYDNNGETITNEYTVDKNGVIVDVGGDGALDTVKNYKNGEKDNGSDQNTAVEKQTGENVTYKTENGERTVHYNIVDGKKVPTGETFKDNNGNTINTKYITNENGNEITNKGTTANNGGNYIDIGMDKNGRIDINSLIDAAINAGMTVNNYSGQNAQDAFQALQNGASIDDVLNNYQADGTQTNNSSTKNNKGSNRGSGGGTTYYGNGVTGFNDGTYSQTGNAIALNDIAMSFGSNRGYGGGGAGEQMVGKEELHDRPSKTEKDSRVCKRLEER